MTPRVPSLRQAALAGVIVLAACGTDGPVRRTDGTGTSTGLATEPAKPAPGRHEPAISLTAASRTPGDTLKVGKGEIVLTPVYDPACKRLVAPFDAGQNVVEIAKVVAASLGDAFAGDLNRYLPGNLTPAGKTDGRTPSAGQAVKHQLSSDVVRAAKRLNWLPMSVEVEYGKTLLKRRQHEIAPRDGARSRVRYERGEALLTELLAGVREPHDYKFELVILSEGGTNAEALPGGFLLLQSGLISARGELHPKARFALGHEIGHVLQRHHTQDLQARLVDALAVRSSAKELLGTIRGANKNPQSLVALLASGMNLLDGHSIDQEFQSDACAVRVLEGGGDRRRMVDDVRAFADSLSAGKPKLAKPVSKTPGTPAEAEATNVAYRVIERFARLGETHPDDGLRREKLLAMLGQPAAALPQRPAVNAPRAAPSPRQPSPRRPASAPG